MGRYPRVDCVVGKEYACNLQDTFRLIGHAITIISQIGVTRGRDHGIHCW